MGAVLYAHTYGEASTPDDFFQKVKVRYPEMVLVDDRCLCIPDLDAPEMNGRRCGIIQHGICQGCGIGFWRVCIYTGRCELPGLILYLSIPIAHEEIDKRL